MKYYLLGKTINLLCQVFECSVYVSIMIFQIYWIFYNYHGSPYLLSVLSTVNGGGRSRDSQISCVPGILIGN